MPLIDCLISIWNIQLMCDACVLLNNNSIKICVLMGSYVLMCLFVLVLRRHQQVQFQYSRIQVQTLPRFVLDNEDTLYADMRELSH